MSSLQDQNADSASAVDRIDLRFLTPTFFRRGDQHHLRPAPSVVFGHLRRRWRDVYGVAPPCELDDRIIDVVRLEVRSATVTARRRRYQGVVGAVSYDLLALEPHERAALDACAQAAPFAGCDAATTFVCGATDYQSTPSSSVGSSSSKS